MKEYFETLPPNLVSFIMVTIFSLLIGLSQRRLHLQNENENSMLFGTDRTFTLIGILGYILYILDPAGMLLFGGGFFILAFLLGINYYFKSKLAQKFGLTSIVTAFITYSLAPLVITQPSWFYLLVIVTILLITEMKETFISFAKKMNNDEFVTLAKFILIIGIVLPMLPTEDLIPGIAISPRSIWLSLVVVSSISYISYLLKRFVFQDSGLLVTGILGGLYGSTATTLILSRKSKTANAGLNQYAGSIILATSMMYVRILIMLAIFNLDLCLHLLPYFILMIAISAGIAVFIRYFKHTDSAVHEHFENDDKNPLEFRVALMFSILFVVFTLLTYYIVQNFGETGLNRFSWIVGISDINPFLTSLFQGKFDISMQALSIATFQAIISNNILKAFYTALFANKKIRRTTILALVAISVINLGMLVVAFY